MTKFDEADAIARTAMNLYGVLVSEIDEGQWPKASRHDEARAAIAGIIRAYGRSCYQEGVVRLAETEAELNALSGKEGS